MENNKKQTAVEWCNQQLVDKQNGNGDSRSWDEIFAEANEMFHEQIEEAHHKGFIDQLNPNEYYEQTYGKQ